MKKKGLIVIGILILLLIASLIGNWVLFGRMQVAELRAGQMGGQLGEVQEQLGYARDRVASLEQQLEEAQTQATGAADLLLVEPLADETVLVVYGDELAEKTISVRRGEGTRPVYRGYVSLPVVSPNRARLAYISDYEWEVIGNLAIFEPEGWNLLTVDNDGLPEQYKVMQLAWLSDDTILAAVGLAYGTVTRGGDLYAYSIAGDSWTLLATPAEENVQISGMIREDDTIKLELTVYDEQYLEYELEEREVLQSELQWYLNEEDTMIVQ